MVENYDFTLFEIVLNKKYLFNWFHLPLECSQGGGNFKLLNGALFPSGGKKHVLNSKILVQEF